MGAGKIDEEAQRDVLYHLSICEKSRLLMLLELPMHRYVKYIHTYLLNKSTVCLLFKTYGRVIHFFHLFKGTSSICFWKIVAMQLQFIMLKQGSTEFI